MTVPNLFPTTPTPNPIAFIGEAPAHHEVETGEPFAGASGHWLTRWLELAGLTRSECYFGNLSQSRAPGDDFRRLVWTGPEIQSGIAQLEADLVQLAPSLVVGLGNAPLHLLREGNTRPPSKWPNAIGDWRGSLFHSPWSSTKALATYHPAAAFRSWPLSAFIRFDLRRAAEERTSRDLQLPDRTIWIAESAGQAVEWLEAVAEGVPFSFDLEGYTTGITAFSFSVDPATAWVVPLVDSAGGPPWELEDEVAIFQALKVVAENPAIPKVLQNSLYDRFVLAWSYGILLRNIAEDTLVKFWEWKCELPKDLGTQASILTREPFWKQERKSEDWHTQLRYCGKDSSVTLEIANRLEELLEPEQLADYRLRLRLLDPFLYMSLRGMRFDSSGGRKLRRTRRKESLRIQHRINQLASRPIPTDTAGWVAALRPICLARATRKEEHTTTRTYKNGKTKTTTKTVSVPVAVDSPALLVEFAKTSRKKEARLARRLLAKPLDSAALGELANIAGLSVNVGSTNQGGDCQQLFYNLWKLPKRWKMEEGRRTSKLTTDEDAILSLIVQTSDQRLVEVLRLRRVLKEISILAARVDSDGRMRSEYGVVGPSTGRTVTRQSPTGSGYNLQTVTKSHRRLFPADPGCLLLQWDLEGADAWTVAAHSAALGDPTMLEDLRAGVKPHAVVAVMKERGTATNFLSREELKVLCKQVDKEGWLYKACKRVVHMSDYLGGVDRMGASILADSCEDLEDFNPLVVGRRELEILQQKCFFGRYWGVREWHQQVRRMLLDKGEFRSACGHRRLFLGKRMAKGDVDRKTWGDALAHEPQLNTTLATLLAILRLWEDPDNRTSGDLLVEPIHSVHDSLVAQTVEANAEWAREKMNQWFDNSLTIAGQSITIPTDGECGINWKMEAATDKRKDEL